MSNGLTAAELAQIRADIGELFPDTCTILSKGGTINAQGDYLDTWGTASSSVPCRVDEKTGKEVLTGGAIVPYQKVTISMAYNATITEANRIVVNGGTFSIQAVNNEQSWAGVKRIDAEKLP